MFALATVTSLLTVLVLQQQQQVAHAELPTPENTYNILFLVPLSSKSHRNVLRPLATALADKGHKITMLTNLPPPDNNPNIHYLVNPLPYFNDENDNMFQLSETPEAIFEYFEEEFTKVGRHFYDIPLVKELYKKRHQFDLFILDSMFNEVSYPFVFGKNFITVAPGDLDPPLSCVMGNLQNPAYVSSYLSEFTRPYSFLDRFTNLFLSIKLPYDWRKSIIPPVESQLKERFPELPNFIEIERNQSLALINTHFTFSPPIPLLPNQVLAGGMHLRPERPLPTDLQDFVSGSTPVIYMSLGSIAKSTHIPDAYKKDIVSAFGKLPYKIIWKLEEQLPNLPKNVFIKEWMPQQDLLAHPNVKLFVSHCGLLGIQEAIYHSTPILGLPLFGDQHKNAAMLKAHGIANWIDWTNFSEQLFIDTISELMKSQRYQQQVSAMSKRFKDQPEKPLDRAVFWTEYVIRHKGAAHLRSPGQQLSWVELFHLDIIAAIHIAGFIAYRTLKKIIELCCGGSSKINKTSRKSKNKRE